MRQFREAQVGDTVRVQFKILEEGAERIQTFEGILLRVRGSGASQTITVRKSSFGIGVERIFPAASPRFADISVVRRGRVRRSKLYYMRAFTGKAHKVAFGAEAGETTSKEQTQKKGLPSDGPSEARPGKTDPLPSASPSA